MSTPTPINSRAQRLCRARYLYRMCAQRRIINNSRGQRWNRRRRSIQRCFWAQRAEARRLGVSVQRNRPISSKVHICKCTLDKIFHPWHRPPTLCPSCGGVPRYYSILMTAARLWNSRDDRQYELGECMLSAHVSIGRRRQCTGRCRLCGEC